MEMYCKSCGWSLLHWIQPLLSRWRMQASTSVLLQQKLKTFTAAPGFNFWQASTTWKVERDESTLATYETEPQVKFPAHHTLNTRLSMCIVFFSLRIWMMRE